MRVFDQTLRVVADGELPEVPRIAAVGVVGRVVQMSVRWANAGGGASHTVAATAESAATR